MPRFLLRRLSTIVLSFSLALNVVIAYPLVAQAAKFDAISADSSSQTIGSTDTATVLLAQKAEVPATDEAIEAGEDAAKAEAKKLKEAAKAEAKKLKEQKKAEEKAAKAKAKEEKKAAKAEAKKLKEQKKAEEKAAKAKAEEEKEATKAAQDVTEETTEETAAS